MDQIEYSVVSASFLRIIRRGETALIKIRIKNNGDKAWFDMGKKKVSEHITLDLVDKEELLDFKIRWGRGEKTNRKFRNVVDGTMKSTKNQHVARPGDTVTFFVQLTARKFATSGFHRIEFAPTVYENKQQALLAGRKRNVWIYVRARKYFWLHLKRTIRLWFTNAGKVDRVFNNKTFKNQGNSKNATAVVMATWQRIENLPRTIESLSRQKEVKPILFLWNNNPDAREEIDEIVTNSNLAVSVWHSQSNIGGFGRFYIAREQSKNYDKIIFIDDDQFPGQEYLMNLTKEFKPRTIKSQWAFKFPDTKNYWHKQLVEKGEEADYCGTGGMIIDSSIFNEPEVFKCPKRFWFIEDLWLSFLANHKYGWKLQRSKTDLLIEEDGKDQFTNMIDLKTKALQYLSKKYGKQHL